MLTARFRKTCNFQALLLTDRYTAISDFADFE